MSKPMTLTAAKTFCRSLGFTLLKRHDEYIVKPLGERDDHPHSYFTSDFDDAVRTARAMHAYRVSGR
jgi:hypothetical protein